MNFKKLILPLLCFFIILPIIFFVICKDDSKLADGIYTVKENNLYPNAYIEIKDNHIQFFNIDLNALYKQNMVKCYIFVQENENGSLSSEEKKEIDKSIDINKFLCEQPYMLNYDTLIKEDTHLYSNMFCKINHINSFGYLYDSKTKTLTFGVDTSNELNFVKQ